MNVFRHSTYTAYEIRPWKIRQRGIVIIRETGNRINARSLWNVHNWRFIVKPSRFNRWHWLIRFPFFYFERNNVDIKIGYPNLYLWIIQ